MTKKSIFLLYSLSFLSITAGVLTPTLISCLTGNNHKINITSYISQINEKIKNNISNWTNTNDIVQVQNKIKDSINEIF